MSYRRPLHVQVTVARVGRVRERYMLTPRNLPLNPQRQLTVRRNRLKGK